MITMFDEKTWRSEIEIVKIKAIYSYCVSDLKKND
jgi:hypothetical protein